MTDFATEMAALPTARKHIAERLRMAAQLIETEDRINDRRAAWRVADAGLLLRRLMERDGPLEPQALGINVPTGMGALLPDCFTIGRQHEQTP